MRITQKMKVFLLLFLLALPVVRLIAQVVDPPEDVVDLVVRFDVLIQSLAGFAAVSVFITGLVNGWSRITKSWVKQVVSWVVPVGSVIIVSALNLGFLADQPVINSVIFGLGCGLVSNGIFDIAFVNTFINWIVGKLGGVTA